MCCPQKQKSNGPFIFTACITLRRIGSTVQGLLGQLFMNIYFFRQVKRHLTRSSKVLHFWGAKTPVPLKASLHG